MADKGDKNGKKLTRFGRYLILDHLADGGMASICSARFLSRDADKIVAIKMVQEKFSSDESFKTMFIDEIKTTFGLIHPNIAQTYDYGEYGSQLYVALELCDGANLKQYLDRLKTRKFVFPVEISVHIITQVCAGLGYAHNFKDKLTGQEGNIIHRDISPHNIMLTYDGTVKVIDFGIAKADGNSEKTQAGTIKGKLSYLAPEYLDGMKLDVRYDQFAVGITLWELLCSRKLFTAENDLAVLKKIQKCKVPPPSKINPNVPKELDEIVLKALSKDREKRYKDMEQFNRALTRFLYAQYPDFNSSDLAYFAKELFKKEITRDQEKLLEHGKIDITPFLEEMERELQNGQEANGATSTGIAVEEKMKKGTEIDMGFEKDSKTGRIQLTKEKDGGLKLEATSTTVTSVSNTSSGTSTRKIKAGLPKVPKSEKGTGVKNKSGTLKIALVAGLGLLFYTQFDKVGEYLGISVKNKKVTSSDRSPSSIGLEDSGETKIDHKKMGKLILHNFDILMDLYVNGKKTTYPSLGLDVPLNKKIELRIVKDGYKALKFTRRFSKGSENQKLFVPKKMESQFYGILYTPTFGFLEGTKLVVDTEDGRQIKVMLPLKRPLKLPVGNYKSKLVSPSDVVQDVEFVIQRDTRTKLEAFRKPASM